jgi:radical SAM superfamily enzyme YgiQ (UPF0313 family)
MQAHVVALVGAEYEENLSLRYLASAVEARGFTARILAFDDPARAEAIADAIVEADAIAVGLSVPFQHRAKEILGLASLLRARGYRGHICVGGHFATFEYADILRDMPAVDSIVRHEGEQTFSDLCERLRAGEPITAFPGLVIRAAASRARLPIAGAGDGSIAVGPERPLPGLDELPFPDRRGEPHDVLGVRCSPIVGSRGCYADCSFCCIFAYADNADGPRYRMRSPENIVREMKEEYDRRGARLFVFHDDNFFVPSPARNIKRYRRMAELIDAEGMTDIALVIKCRPNDIDQELFELLRSMGMIRAYVGIETNSDEGVVSLNRRITSEDNRRALLLLRELDVYCSFNVLMFDPEATLAGVEANLAFMAEFADVPFNFCRAEVYAGTPLRHRLESEGRLQGDYFAWNYQMRQPRVELLFRIASTAFASRNFKPDGVHNLNMGIRFDNEVLRFFYPAAWDPDWQARLRELSRDVGRHSVERMRGALAFVRSVDPYDQPAVKSFTLELAREVARADLRFVARIQGLRREMERRIEAHGGPVVRRSRREAVPWAAETARLGTSVGLGVSTEVLPEPSLPGTVS